MNIIKIISTAAMAAMIAFGSLVSADESADNKVTVIMDGAEIVSDVPAMIINDRAMLPFRAVLESFGTDVDWNEEYRLITAVREETVLTLMLDKFIMVKMNLLEETAEQIELDAAPQIVDERTLVPVRAVAEALDAEVGWDADTRTVTILSMEEDK